MAGTGEPPSRTRGPSASQNDRLWNVYQRPRLVRFDAGRLDHPDEGVALKRCIPSRNELALSSLSFWTFSLVSRPMPSPDQSDDGPNGAPEEVRAKSKYRADHHVIAGQRYKIAGLHLEITLKAKTFPVGRHE